MASPYVKLALISGFHLMLMFLLTYTLISSFDHFLVNINRLYMSVLMVSPMVIIMLVGMRSMFQSTGLNRILIGGSAGLFILTFFLARSQTPVGNEQFLRSMIPHHSSAILMCEEAAITDTDIRLLCDRIIRAQKDEIAQMKAILTGTVSNPEPEGPRHEPPDA